MGVIAFNPMLRAGYDVKLAAGVITAGGTLGILIPPSVMIIVYAAVAGQSVVKLYAAAMFPGFFLSLLYVAYVIGLGPAKSENRAASSGKRAQGAGASLDGRFRQGLFGDQHVRRLLKALASPGKARAISADDRPISYRFLITNLLYSLVPAAIIFGSLWGIYWYVVIHQQRRWKRTSAASSNWVLRTCLPARPRRRKWDRRIPSTGGSSASARSSC